MNKKQLKELQEFMNEFERFSGCAEVNKSDLKELTENLTQTDLEEIKEAFSLLTKFYGGIL